MIPVSMAAEGDPGAVFDAAIPGVDAAVARATGRTGAWFQTQVKANASGRPGPRAPTGDYRRSIGLTNTTQAGVAVSTIATNLPQARRLEWGFFGEDALGRNYRQPPYPHWRPAIALVGGVFAAELERALQASRRTT